MHIVAQNHMPEPVQTLSSPLYDEEQLYMCMPIRILNCNLYTARIGITEHNGDNTRPDITRLTNDVNSSNWLHPMQPPL